MRQIVSLLKDNQVHYALVDDDDGSLIPFADLLIPDPERFGLHESAVLGTNLVTALGLNGTKRPKTAMVSLANVPPTHRQTEPGELPAPPPGETPRERRNRIAREGYRRKKAGGSTRPNTKSNNSAQRYISLEQVMEVVNQYPDGIRVRDVAELIWRATDGQGTDEPHPPWVYTSVSNRLTAARVRLRDQGIPLPFREEDRPVPDKGGKYGGFTGKFLAPLASSE